MAQLTLALDFERPPEQPAHGSGRPRPPFDRELRHRAAAAFVLPFGPHRDRTLAEAHAADRAYLGRLLLRGSVYGPTRLAVEAFLSVRR